MSPIYVGNRRIIGTQSSDPTGLGVNDEGSVYYNSTDDKLRAWDGSADDAGGAAVLVEPTQLIGGRVKALPVPTVGLLNVDLLILLPAAVVH